MNYKKAIKPLILSGFVLAMIGTQVSARSLRSLPYSFAGSAAYDYVEVGETVMKTTDSATRAQVNCSFSDEGSHREWFQVVNSRGESKAKIRIESCDGVTRFMNESTTEYGYYYALEAAREHEWDPTTYVSGTWQP